MDPDHEEGPSKKKRGPYKRYLDTRNVPVPESTLMSRMKDRTVQEERPRPLPDPPIMDVEVVQEVIDDGGRGNADEELAEHLAEAQEAVCHPIESETVDNLATNTEGLKKEVDYIKKYLLNDRLHRDFPMSRLDVLLMILHLAIRHCHTQGFIEHQIEFVNSLFGANVLDISYHIFKKLFPPSSCIVKHYFCTACDVCVGTDKDFQNMTEITCPEAQCERKIIVNSVDSGNYFVTFSLREQIENLLEKPDIKLVDFSNRVSSNICDIFDGELYKRFSENGISNGTFLTATFNTDGVAVFKSTHNSMWPIMLHLNEIIPEQRFLSDNIILGGLWFGKSAPNMALYLKPVIEQMLELSQNGVSYSKPDGSCNKFPVYPLACSADSIAKPKLLCQKQFNAYCACPYCFHPNNATVEGSKQRFYDTSESYPVRTEEDIIRDMYEADRRDRAGELKEGSVNGFLGISVLLILSRLVDSIGFNPFHIVWSVVIDYMHCVLEGVTSNLLDFYQNLLTPEKLSILNDRISHITPSQAMTRKPRTLKEKIKWKAKESRAFLLYYSLPCLEDLLARKHFDNLKHLVQSMHVLLSENITPAELNFARSSLGKFTNNFQSLYGLESVTFNLHLLTHLCDLVEKLGPIWCYSNFVFESVNGRLIRLVQGTRSVINEIAIKFTKLQNIPRIIENNQISDSALLFCNDILGSRYYSHSGEFFGKVCVTSKSLAEINETEQRLFEESNVGVSNNNEVTFYHRAISKGTVYCSRCYSKTKAFDDSCVLLSDNKYAVIDKIVSTSDNKLVCLIKPINVVGAIIASVKRCAFQPFGHAYIVPFENILRKCVLIRIAEKHFVCDIPNLCERD